MFRSYETGREGFVTLIANYLPLQDAFGGPNYFTLDPEARYRIQIENDGDPGADLVFEFRFANFLNGQTVPVGDLDVPVPLRLIGPIPGTPLNTAELYTVRVIRGGDTQQAINAANQTPFFAKTLDHFGTKTFPDYEAYARSRITPIRIPGCGDGRVFVGQRRESFAVNLGEIFDLVNLDPVGDPAAARSSTADKNITSLALEVPIDCLAGDGPVIGGWTTALLPRTRVLVDDPSFGQPALTGGDLVQVSRLGMPLVNEVVIGLGDKDRFNASRPQDDGQFAHYVTNPSLPALLETLFGVAAPSNLPRQDLLAAFVTGLPGINALGFGEMLRLDTAIAPTPRSEQSNLGLLGGDPAGFPNGRRPGDDTVDATLRVAMGALCQAFPGTFGCDANDAPAALLPFTDQAYQGADQFDQAFPYLRTPLAGAPNRKRVFAADLRGTNEVPSLPSPNMGACTALIDPTLPEVIVSCTHDVQDVVAAHIHNGPADANGPIVCGFGTGTSPLLFVCNQATLEGIAFDDFVRQLEEGRLYVNFHSQRNPPGEIRGQLQ